jgi:exodeoxyribonuclease V alpha subunit
MSTLQSVTTQQVNATPQYETITGVVERLTFHSEESGYTVPHLVRLCTTDLTTIVGSLSLEDNSSTMALAALTGRAAQCLAEITELETKTIHMSLQAI